VNEAALNAPSANDDNAAGFAGGAGAGENVAVLLAPLTRLVNALTSAAASVLLIPSAKSPGV
jgi:hypothetical protein